MVYSIAILNKFVLRTVRMDAKAVFYNFWFTFISLPHSARHPRTARQSSFPGRYFCCRSPRRQCIFFFFRSNFHFHFPWENLLWTYWPNLATWITLYHLLSDFSLLICISVLCRTFEDDNAFENVCFCLNYDYSMYSYGFRTLFGSSCWSLIISEKTKLD